MPKPAEAGTPDDKADNGEDAAGPGAKSPKEAGPLADRPPSPAPALRWETADKNVRETGKWIITTITGFTGLVFASGGFLAKGDFSERYFWQRALAMLVGAAAAALGLSGLIGLIARTLAPDEPTLNTLPKSIVDDIEEAPGNYFPDDIKSMDRFRTRYVFWHKRAKDLESECQRTKIRLDAATARVPPDQTAIDRLTRNHSALASATEDARGNWSDFREARDAILSRARYSVVRTSFVDGGWKLVGSGLLLILGAATYLIAASFKPTEPKPEAAVERPVLAKLTKGVGAAADRLWNAAGLASCENPPGTVPVLLEDGDGTIESPWQLRTMPNENGCVVVKFSVIGEVATVVVPNEKITIDYVTTTTTTKPRW